MGSRSGDGKTKAYDARRPTSHTLDRYVDELVAMRGELAAVLAMLDHSEFMYLCHTPQVPAEARDRALASGQRRFANWRGAVARMLKASRRLVKISARGSL